MELYVERGFEQTTVAEIAERADLTERTFFRHFTDKREVLFRGAGLLQDHILNALLAAPVSSTPLDAVTIGLEAAGDFFQGNPERSRIRQSIIQANAELQARELSKMAALATAISGALRQRGVSDPAADLTAEAGVVIFRTAFERWVSSTGEEVWTSLIRAALDDLKAVMLSAP
ncbi:TetR family transcriptional regulator [Deinococcus ruber]|uniref:TetR family transcriptional regulator n=2 Tax=Deinococcus ruber TaxID=1848197 RepID=A0A918F957_9DEIO|nr:TetR family transcriptional regulator [Deinococcus ruber]